MTKSETFIGILLNELIFLIENINDNLDEAVEKNEMCLGAK